MFDYKIINTGSDGNCIIINENIMLDCGLSYTKIKKYIKHIKFIFISHKHSDHFNKTTFKRIIFEHPNIKFIVGEYMVEELVKIGAKPKNIWALQLDNWYDIGFCKVKMDMLFHDVPNNCLHIWFYNDDKILYATDTSKINHVTAKNYTHYFIEANYETKEELQEKIKKEHEEGKFSHYERVLVTHLSQLDAINWLDANKGENSNYTFIHGHKEHEPKNL